MSENRKNDNRLYFPYKGKTVAHVSFEEKDSLSKWCSCSGGFAFEEGYKTLHSMFFYRCSWLDYIILPKSMRFVEKYSCVPYIRAIEHKIIEHKKSDYRFPSEWAVHRNKLGYYVSKTEKSPLSVVIKSPSTIFDSCAFGDGDENISFFLEFKSEYDISNIKSNIVVYPFGEWDYVNGVPTPK